MLMTILGGFLMALADSVPGVSGGTIAFLMGIYDDFIGSLNNVLSKEKEKRKKAILFLVKLLSGWVVGFIGAVLVITALFEQNIYEISSLFIGFVIFAIPLVVMEEKECLKGKYYNLIFLLMGAALVVAITYFANGGSAISLKWGEFDVITGILLFLGAMVAISAMVLPGISGSTILLVFGFYQPILFAIEQFLHLDFSYFVGLCIFGSGMIAGIITTVRGLKIVLSKARSATVYVILGMMLGSLYSIVVGPTSLKDNPRPAMTFETFNILFFIIGGVVILGLQFLKAWLAKREANKTA